MTAQTLFEKIFYYRKVLTQQVSQMKMIQIELCH